jgi:catechol 2,3-dioxygenase-like lactoylglutathione lyase family enzyme
MKLNHLNLTVPDVIKKKKFLEQYFGMRSGGGNKNIGFMFDDSGMVLTLTHMKVGRELEVKYPATFHVGFIQESEERVNEINARLKQDGFDVPPPSRQHGSWTFYFLSPGDLLSKCCASRSLGERMVTKRLHIGIYEASTTDYAIVRADGRHGPARLSGLLN